MKIPYKIGDKVECSCGCGSLVTIKHYHIEPYGIKHFGLKRYLHGHNNHGPHDSGKLNLFWKNMSSDERKKFQQQKFDNLKKRGWVSPQLGRTKENSEIIKKATEKMKQTKNSKWWKETIGKQVAKKNSIRIRQMVKDGTFKRQGVTTIGKNHSTLFKKNKTYNEIYGFRSLTERRKRSAAHQDIPLDKWKKFIGFEPYDENFSDQFKRSIRKRDNQICMNCSIHREKLKRPLIVHHINYDKKCSIEQNCITLCNKCHPSTNINRAYWTKLFQDKLSKLYGYSYENNTVIINLNDLKK